MAPSADLSDFRSPLNIMPMAIGDGAKAYLLPTKWLRAMDERYVGLSFITRRRLFGLGYQALVGRSYDRMPPGSGVLIAPFLDTKLIVPGATLPGDIDLLILPYEHNELLVSRALAVEVKVVRASFLKQGKSPNEFGFSQAKALLDLGFPNVAVAHLIVSDQSPPRYWKKMAVTTMLNAETGEVDELADFYTDVMPSELMRRSFGRLLHRSPDPKLGLLASYVAGEGCWFPEGRASSFNPNTRIDVLESLKEFYWSNAHRFLLTPKFPLTA